MSWRHRWLLWSFTRRELLNRYAGSLAGTAWAVAHPLALLAVFGFVFTGVFKVQLPPEAGTGSYIAFLAITLWPWLMFSEGLTRGMAAVRANEGLIRKVAFPHRLVVYAAVLSSFGVHAIGYIVVLFALRLAGEPIALSGLPVAFMLLVILALATTGIAAILAATQTMLRDLEQVIPVVMVLLFYATPILYPLALVPEKFKPVVAVNPLAQLVERLRETLLANSGFAAGDLWLLLIAGAIFAAGLWYFDRLSPFFEDFL
jgi:ABC-type polysaccharide/polyol phosphate export permease